MTGFIVDREELRRAHQALVDENLVVGTQGNVSKRMDAQGILIKASGVPYPLLGLKDMVLVSWDGEINKDSPKPSTDTFAHLAIYRNLPNVNAIVHTHSVYATAFAALGIDIPCVLTAMADEFGGDIPCTPYCEIGDAEVGLIAARYMPDGGVTLIQNHGVFAVGGSVKEAVKKAVMAENAAKTVFLAMSLGRPINLSRNQIESCFNRYRRFYGQ